MHGNEQTISGAAPLTAQLAGSQEAQSARHQGTVVLAHGCFDLLHAGHIDHLLEAKKLGDWLVVSVTPDEWVRKGAWRPHYTAQERAQHLRSLAFVDQVVIGDGPTAANVIERIKPDLYVKGIDYAGVIDGGLAEEIAAVTKHGGSFVPTKAPKASSSRLLARVQHGDAIGDYLDGCRGRGFWERIDAAFTKARSLNVAFVGETIIDEYRFVSALGKPSKEFVLAVAEESREEFLGGVVAAKRHAEKLCKAAYVTQEEGELRKTRYVGRDFGQKIFEVYSDAKLALSERTRARFLHDLDGSCRFADAVVVFDFGHGLMNREARALLRGAKFLAVNAQSNAGNQGFNSVVRYPHANYVCVDLPEARFAAQEQHANAAEVVTALDNTMEPAHLIVTNGKDGAYWKGGRVPAFATLPRDTIGAGDCFLAVTAPLIAAGLGTEEAALVGNVAGAMKTEIVGHRAAIDADVLYRSVQSFLK